jgi:hypothetical protein
VNSSHSKLKWNALILSFKLESFTWGSAGGGHYNWTCPTRRSCTHFGQCYIGGNPRRHWKHSSTSGNITPESIIWFFIVKGAPPFSDSCIDVSSVNTILINCWMSYCYGHFKFGCKMLCSWNLYWVNPLFIGWNSMSALLNNLALPLLKSALVRTQEKLQRPCFRLC